ncbi:MAG: hypothetical protein IIW08_03560, partial [Clostridia bacterium]|nr:hypothetical protein [Clostridia bacterium]
LLPPHINGTQSNRKNIKQYTSFELITPMYVPFISAGASPRPTDMVFPIVRAIVASHVCHVFRFMHTFRNTSRILGQCGH